VVFSEKYSSQNYSDLALIIRTFFDKHRVKQTPQMACIAAAGPVSGGCVKLTNLPWEINAAQLGVSLGIADISLINDVEAAAYAVDDEHVNSGILLQEGRAVSSGASVVVNIGTGFGQALRVNNGGVIQVMASEGGHVDFAPVNDNDLALFRFLSKELNRVSVESVLSGPGLVRIYRYLNSQQSGKADEMLNSIDIVRKAGEGEAQAINALRYFFELLAGHLGNIILTYLPVRGIYIMGSVLPAMVGYFPQQKFITALADRGAFSELIKSKLIKILTQDDLGLAGASKLAQLRLKSLK